MRPSLSLWKKSASSSRWLTRQANDPYVKARTANTTGDAPAYRSRSSFKLLSMNAKHPFLLAPKPEFEGDKIVVDLGAAPGGWSQAAAHLMGGQGRVFALDILDFTPLPGVHSLKGDFLDPKVQADLRAAINEFRPPQFGLAAGYESGTGEENRERVVDVVLSDMMAPMTGVRLRDVAASLDLVQAASSFAFSTLRSGQGEETWLSKGQQRYPGGHLL
jgi:23S rRNA (uridine2552-2'-O)-methyltransferase